MKYFILLMLSFSICFGGEKNSTLFFEIGELGNKWEFESDHLPIALNINDIEVIFWNILDRDYLHWIEKNGQGLKESAILRDNVPGKVLTVREEKIIEKIQACHGDLIALEEMNGQVLVELEKALPDYALAVIPEYPWDVFFYKKDLFDFVDLKGFPYAEHRIWQALTLKERKTGLNYLFIQAHIPGGEESAPARKKYAEGLLNFISDKSLIVVMGDQNRSPDYFEKDLKAAALVKGISVPLINVPVPYPTHMNTRLEASWIDNFFVSASSLSSVRIEDLSYFSSLNLPNLWEYFPLNEEIAKTKSVLDPKGLSLFETLLPKLRWHYLKTEKQFDLKVLLEDIGSHPEKLQEIYNEWLKRIIAS